MKTSNPVDVMRMALELDEGVLRRVGLAAMVLGFVLVAVPLPS